MPTPEEQIAKIAPNLVWQPHPIGDPIWMEYVIEQDPAVRNQLAAVRLQAVADVYQTISQAAANAAKVLGARPTP
jgi:hypothetical protein